MHYLPLLEPRADMEDFDDFLEDEPPEHRVDLAVPFKKSVKQVAREVRFFLLIIALTFCKAYVLHYSQFMKLLGVTCQFNISN
jgi:hypothetical protein